MKTFNQTAIIFLILFISVNVLACKKDKSTDDSSKGKTGTFKIDGIDYSGNTETQTFVNNNYSVVCQQDEPFKLIQITFHNQAEAEAGGTFKVEDYSLNISTNSVQIGIDGLTFDPNGSHTISVSNKKITINNIPLIQTGSGSKHPLVNNTSINF